MTSWLGRPTACRLRVVARSAALHAAQTAALLGLVAETDELRRRALQLTEDDETAFAAVADAYQLPRDTDAAKATRSAAIATATALTPVPGGIGPATTALLLHHTVQAACR